MAASAEPQARLYEIAEKIVASAIQGFEQIQELDETCVSSGAPDDDAFDTEAAIVLRLMYEERAQEAERILTRIARLERAGRNVEGADTLRDWHGRTMAMLSVSLEDIARGIEQSKQGNVVMAGEIRNELQSRLHR
ncbi:MAG: hypothetical protein JWO87_560 [Phycisphaerales bacterium]|nr:hypothetical protein [Phycisphaerales bacterium]MDB5298897.1 hypothetical protein [Phycisphaerales bacterium]